MSKSDFSFSPDFLKNLAKNNIKYTRESTRPFLNVNEKGVLSGTLLDTFKHINVVFAIGKVKDTVNLYLWIEDENIIDLLEKNRIEYARGVITGSSILTNKTLKQFYKVCSEILPPVQVKKIKAVSFSKENITRGENHIVVSIHK